MLLRRGPRGYDLNRYVFFSLTCVFTFAVGIYTGKAFVENQTKISNLASCASEIAQLKTELQKKTDEPRLPATADTSKINASSLDSLDGEATDEIPSMPPIPADPLAPAEKSPGTVAAPATEKQPAQNRADDRTQNDPENTETAPHSQSAKTLMEPQPILGKFTIQLEAVPDKATAAQRVDSLKDKGLDAFVIMKDLGDKGTFYRVNLGHFETYKDARSYRNDLQAKNLISKEVFIRKVDR